MSDCISCFWRTHQKFEMERMLKTLHHFHPEVTVEAFDNDDMVRNNLGAPYAFASIGLFLRNEYDTITHIDADVLIVDRIDELLDTSSDVRAGRNNSDTGKAGFSGGFTLPGIGVHSYVNAGIHSVTNQAFWNDWYDTCMREGHRTPLGEQGIFNKIFYSGRYKNVVLDPIQSNIHYGTSFQYGRRDNWESWKNIRILGDKLFINNKQIKMMHIAGGGLDKPPLETLVNKDVLDFLNNIINS
jgi:hypothetical protein